MISTSLLCDSILSHSKSTMHLLELCTSQLLSQYMHSLQRNHSPLNTMSSCEDPPSTDDSSSTHMSVSSEEEQIRFSSLHRSKKTGIPSHLPCTLRVDHDLGNHLRFFHILVPICIYKSKTIQMF